MDYREKTYLAFTADPDSDQPWFQPAGEAMPADMKQFLMKGLGKLPAHKRNTTPVVRFFIRSVAAACLLALVSYCWEQGYSLKKLNALENRLASDTQVSYHGFDQLDRVLVMNSLIDWDKLKSLGPERAREQYADALPAWFNANLLGDSQMKLRLDQQINAFQLNLKIK